MISEQKDKYIVTFSRDENNVRNIKREEFNSYFYVGNEVDIINDDRILKIEDTSKKSLFGESVKKIIVKNPYDVFNLRLSYYQTFEGDVPYIWRYFIDRVKEIPKENLRKWYLDIETKDFPDTQLNNQPITCIAWYDNYNDSYTTVVVDESVDIKDGKVHSTFIVEEREKHTIYRCVTEYVLLSKFCDLIHDIDPDMIIAHNGDKFDFPVIIGRLVALSVMGYGRMSPVGIVKRDNKFGEWKTKIGGRILFDFLGARTPWGVKGGIRGLLDGRDITIKDSDGNDKIVRIKRWSLAYLAQFVKMKKGEYEKCQTLEELIQYNKLDVQIMLELDKYFNVSEYYHNMQMLLGCPYEVTYFNTNMIDFFLMKRYNQYVFPTKPERGKFDNDETIKGADVTEPKQGLYQKIDVVDQTSLYPSAIVSFNMSPETVDSEGDLIVGNGVRFTSKKVGIIADAVQFLLDIRLKYKKLAKTESDPHKAQMYDLLQNGYKTLLVSFYGAMLFKGFRLYQHDVAESIPAVGRDIKVNHVKPIVEKHGYEIVAGDTDSSFLNSLRNDATEINKLVDIINISYDEYAKAHGIKKHIFHIELDKTYSPIIMSDVKKRYVGYLIKNNKKIYKATGFESVRRDASPITELMQESVFKMVLDGKSKKETDEFINNLKSKAMSGEFSLSVLVLPKGFNKAFDKFKTDSPWVRAAKYSNDNLGTHFDQFSELGIFYVKSVPEGKPYTDVVAIDETTTEILNGFTIDWKTQLDKTIISKYENIKEMLGWEDFKQKSLFEF